MAYTPLTFFRNWKESGFKEASKIEIGRNFVGKDLDDVVGTDMYKNTTLKGAVAGALEISAGKVVKTMAMTLPVIAITYGVMSKNDGDYTMQAFSVLMGGCIWQVGDHINDDGIRRIRGRSNKSYTLISEKDISQEDFNIYGPPTLVSKGKLPLVREKVISQKDIDSYGLHTLVTENDLPLASGKNISQEDFNIYGPSFLSKAQKNLSFRELLHS